MSEPIVAAIIGLAGGVLGSIAVLVTNALTLARAHKLEDAAERVARALLEHPNYQLRTFDNLKRRLRGFSDDELRKILVRAGAVSFAGADGTELWGLLDRNKDQLD